MQLGPAAPVFRYLPSGAVPVLPGIRDLAGAGRSLHGIPSAGFCGPGIGTTCIEVSGPPMRLLLAAAFLLQDRTAERLLENLRSDKIEERAGAALVAKPKGAEG